GECGRRVAEVAVLKRLELELAERIGAVAGHDVHDVVRLAPALEDVVDDVGRLRGRAERLDLPSLAVASELAAEGAVGQPFERGGIERLAVQRRTAVEEHPTVRRRLELLHPSLEQPAVEGPDEILRRLTVVGVANETDERRRRRRPSVQGRVLAPRL